MIFAINALFAVDFPAFNCQLPYSVAVAVVSGLVGLWFGILVRTPPLAALAAAASGSVAGLIAAAIYGTSSPTTLWIAIGVICGSSSAWRSSICRVNRSKPQLAKTNQAAEDKVAGKASTGLESAYEGRPLAAQSPARATPTGSLLRKGANNLIVVLLIGAAAALWWWREHSRQEKTDKRNEEMAKKLTEDAWKGVQEGTEKLNEKVRKELEENAKKLWEKVRKEMDENAAFNLGPPPLAGLQKRTPNALKYMEVDVGGGAKMKLVYIEPGKFIMGSPEEEMGRSSDELQHKVEITKGFYMGVFEVTQQEYENVIGKNPSFFKGMRLPVEQVSWEPAMEFCKRLSKNTGKSFDLPTEAEWEYACRAGGKEPFHYGNSLSSKQANFNGERFPYGGAAKGPYLQKSAPVGSYEPNAFGLYDMHGNVWEWCKDWYQDGYYKESPLRDPQGPAKGEGRVFRGGGWDNTGMGCRSANRFDRAPDDDRSISGDLGFRVVVRLP